MKIFISWSGERSRQVGLLLRSWLKCVLQASTPWMSEVDIERGAAWFSEINKALEDCINGIICITNDNQNKPWLLFEAGALAKGLDSSRVCTLLIDLEPKDVSVPLSQFNHTLPDVEGMKKLVKTLNSRMGGYALQIDILETVFNTYWPQFESKLSDIVSTTANVITPVLKEQDVFNEVITAVRRIERRLVSIENANRYRYLDEDAQLISKKKKNQINISNVSSYACDICRIVQSAPSYEDTIKTICNNFNVSEDDAMKILVDMATKIKESQFNDTAK